MSALLETLWSKLIGIPAEAQTLVLVLASYVEEDITTIGATLLYSQEKISWWVCFLGCLGGIWIGDLLNYLLGRYGGRPLLRFPLFRRIATEEKLLEYEKAFLQGQKSLLFIGRFVPTARFPTQFTAGVIRLPFWNFLKITTVAVLLWTPLLIGITLLIGPALLSVFISFFETPWLAGVVTLFVVFFLMRTLSILSKPYWRIEWMSRLRSYGRWEFWPPWLFYIPVGFHYFWHTLKFRHPLLPSLTNPGMEYGGFIGESKYKIMSTFQGKQEFLAKTFLLPLETDLETRFQCFETLFQQHQLTFPIVFKPDVGQRGRGVRVLRDREQVFDYLKKCPISLVVQEYALGPIELGVFYYRFPQESQGKIFSITRKEFPHLLGDGHRAIHQLLVQHPRARYQIGTFLRRFGKQFEDVLKEGEIFPLVEIGNHCQGSFFRDGSRLITPELETRIDEISKTFPGFYFGRYDLRGTSLEEIQAGKNFKIVELNGVTSEATHIYDPELSLRNAYQVLFKQWSIAWNIADQIRKNTTLEPLSCRELLQQIFRYRKLTAQCSPLG